MDKVQSSSLLVLILCIWMHLSTIWTLGHAELTFLEGTTPGAPTRALLNTENSVSARIPITQTQFPIAANVTVTEAYVSENGLISFDRTVRQPPQTPGTGFYPDIMTPSDYVIAPFWSDNDIRGNVRKVTYGIHTSSINSQHLAAVSQFIGNETGTDFSGEWMLLVQWRECHPFPYGANIMTSDPYLQQTNTYQAAVVTDGSTRSYAVFIYNCNRTQWGGRNMVYARVGVRIGSSEILHPLSGSSSVSDIDCENEPTSPWVNVLYDLVNLDGPNSTSSIQPSSTLNPSIVSTTSLLLTLTPSSSAFTSIASVETVPLISQSAVISPTPTMSYYTTAAGISAMSEFFMTTSNVGRSQFQSGTHTLVSHTPLSTPPIEGEQQSGVPILTIGLVTAAVALVILVTLVLLTTGLVFVMYGKHLNKVQSTTVNVTHSSANSNGLKSSLFVTNNKHVNTDLLLLEESYN